MRPSVVATCRHEKVPGRTCGTFGPVWKGKLNFVGKTETVSGVASCEGASQPREQAGIGDQPKPALNPDQWINPRA
jgi:hypothetical protein